jgi:hypothetical protein
MNVPESSFYTKIRHLPQCKNNLAILTRACFYSATAVLDHVNFHTFVKNVSSLKYLSRCIKPFIVRPITMKELTLRITESKFQAFPEFVKTLDYVEVPEADKRSMSELQSSLTQVKMMKEGKIEKLPVEDLLTLHHDTV